MIRFQYCLFLACLVSCFDVAVGQDWPQLHGPNRNAIATNATLFTDWPQGDLEKIWKHTVGQGYAGPAIVNNQLIIYHRMGGENICEKLDAKTGERIWQVAFPAKYEGGGVDRDLGPKAVPVVVDDKIILFGPSGGLHCIKLDSGETVWTKSVLREYRAREGYFGAGSTPIVIDNKVIVNVGGLDSAVVAFNLDDGEQVWRAFDDQASYSSPIASPDGSTVFVITRFHLLGINVADGKVKWELPFGKRGPTVNGANPVLIGDKLFVNSSYRVGARMIQLSEDFDSPKMMWENDTTFSSQYSTPLYQDGFFFGTSGREDMGGGEFKCFEAESGKVKWAKELLVGHSLLVGDQIIHIECNGTLRIIKADTEKYTELYQTELFIVPVRCAPAISGNRLYVRTNAFGPKGQLACFAIGPDAEK